MYHGVNSFLTCIHKASPTGHLRLPVYHASSSLPELKLANYWASISRDSCTSYSPDGECQKSRHFECQRDVVLWLYAKFRTTVQNEEDFISLSTLAE